MMTEEQFLHHLRYALNHLYDPHYLHDSPLADLLGVTDRANAPAGLRRILTEAIEALKPAGSPPSQSRAWRIYELLFYRYVQQFNQQEVADQLGLSVRHLRREQQIALEELACRLREQFDLTDKLDATENKEAAAATEPVEAIGPAAVADTAVSEDLTWLKDGTEKTSDLGQTLPTVLNLVRPLAARHGVALDIVTADFLPDLAVHPVALRQVLLNLLSTAIPKAEGGRVRISAQPSGWEVEIQVVCTDPGLHPSPILDDDRRRLDMTRQLTSLSGGQVTLSPDERIFAATLRLPILERFPVLVIDDNADVLQLLQRYASGTRYQVFGARDPEQAISLAEQLLPQIIVLDVMMPKVDGWEVLGRLQQHPITGHIPIVVCTILAQEELALSLGASAFLRKPLSRQAFLAALDQQVSRLATKPH
jgi:CheY-like chemotaxis protein/signal transduction histidine kinase